MVRQKVKVQFLIMVCRPVRCGQYSEGGEQGEQCHQAKEDGEFLFLIFMSPPIGSSLQWILRMWMVYGVMMWIR